MKVLMVGVDESTKGGMWTVVENYINDARFVNNCNLKYIPTSIRGNILKKLLFNIFSIIKIFFYTIFNDYNILHVHMSEKGSVFRKGMIMNISKIRKAKIVIHMHGAEFEKWYNTLNDKKQKKVKKILNQSDKVILLGKYWIEFISSLMIDKTKIEVVYNAVKCPEEKKYNLKTKQLLFLGVVGKRKGIYDLLDAMEIVKSKNIDTILNIYGPDETEGIDNIIKNRKLEDYVIYKGWLDKKNKEEVFKNTAINILPSYNEGLPMTILETMSYGIPNISTNVAAIPEVISIDNGFLIEPGNPNQIADSIIALIQNEKERKTKSEKSFQLISEKFSVNNHLNEILKLYEELL